jgi:hypothetical protein
MIGDLFVKLLGGVLECLVRACALLFAWWALGMTEWAGFELTWSAACFLAFVTLLAGPTGESSK